MHHRAKVGPPHLFDVIGAQQFCVLAGQGLREHHRLLDVGCGCLRGGRFLIPYLARGNYCGLEPDVELLTHGLADEVGYEQIARKGPKFHHFSDFRLSQISGQFDYVLAQSVLTHAGCDLVPYIFNEASGVLVDGGAFVATWFDGEKDCEDTGWVARALVYSASTIAGRALDAGFTRLDVLDVVHPMGQTWFVARKGEWV